MVRIATIHYGDDRWIDLQLRHLESHTDEPYLVYARLYRIDHRHHSRFHWVGEGVPNAGSRRRHGASLEEVAADWALLAEAISREGDGDDPIVFLHGDAFPLEPWTGRVREMLAGAPLAGVRRDEEFEPFPHPCFTVSTVGFWSGFGADWSLGDPLVIGGVSHNDLGTALLERLEAAGIEWHPILRSNAWSPDPVWFGVYGGFLYHHGAGFRRSLSMRNVVRSERRALPRRMRLVERKLRRRRDDRRSRRMFERIRRDESVLEKLAGTGAER